MYPHETSQFQQPFYPQQPTNKNMVWLILVGVTGLVIGGLIVGCIWWFNRGGNTTASSSTSTSIGKSADKSIETSTDNSADKQQIIETTENYIQALKDLSGTRIKALMCAEYYAANKADFDRQLQEWEALSPDKLAAAKSARSGLKATIVGEIIIKGAAASAPVLNNVDDFSKFVTAVKYFRHEDGIWKLCRSAKDDMGDA